MQTTVTHVQWIEIADVFLEFGILLSRCIPQERFLCHERYLVPGRRLRSTVRRTKTRTTPSEVLADTALVNYACLVDFDKER